MPQANRPSFRGVLYAGVGLTAIAALVWVAVTIFVLFSLSETSVDLLRLLR